MIHKLKMIKNIIVIIMIICFFLNIMTNKSFALSVEADVDLYNYYQQIEYQAQREFILSLSRRINRYGTIPGNVVTLFNDLTSGTKQAYFYNRNNGNLCARSSHYVNGESNNEITIYVFNSSDILINSDSFAAGVWFPGISSGNSNETTYPCYRVQALKGMIVYLENQGDVVGSGSWAYTNQEGQVYYDTTVKSNIPRGTLSYCDEFRYLLENYKDTDKFIDYFKNGDINSNIIQIRSAVENTEQDVEEMKEDVKAMKDFVTNTNKSVDTQLPSDSGTSDVTADGFNNIFMRFYNLMTQNNIWTTVNIPIPFTNNSITLRGVDIVDFWISLGVIDTLVYAVWYFLVSLYIVKDIQKIIQKVQDGSIMTSSDTNIKTEML